MQKKDTKTKQYTRDPVIFADAFNQHFYHGEEVVKAEELQEMDSTEVVFFADGFKKVLTGQRIRDVKKKWIFMQDGKKVYCLLAIENQSEIHYAMPLRVALYDIMQLIDQWNAIRATHERNIEDKVLSNSEYMSGFWKEDKLVPIITLVIYYSPDAWDGPRSLREMYADSNNIILSKALDYEMNLIEPYNMTDEELKQFHSELKQAITYIKYSGKGQKEELRHHIEQDEQFKSLGRNTAELLKEITGAKFRINSGEERVNMCIAEQEWADEAREEGREEGRQEGISSCIEICKELKCSFEETMGKIKEKFKLKDSEAKKHMQLYWSK